MVGGRGVDDLHVVVAIEVGGATVAGLHWFCGLVVHRMLPS